jgi:tyrosyl-tRNA synthetase
MLVRSGLVKSKSEARQAVQQGGVSVDGEKIADIKTFFSKEDLAEGKLLRRGKKSYMRVIFK